MDDIARTEPALALEWEAELLDALAPGERSAFDRILTKLMRRANEMRARSGPTD